MESIALGIIAKYADCTTGIQAFIQNALKYGHSLDRIIFAYSHGLNKQGIEKLRSYTQVDLLPINHGEMLYKKLKERGMSQEEYRSLVIYEELDRKCLVPYGIYRNNVLLWAILSGVDYLFFIDTDVYPQLLVEEDGNLVKREVDFFGRHLSYLKDKGTLCTTSDYSGYYIIPPMNFQGIKILLEGLQKEEAYPMITEGQCLVTTQSDQVHIHPTNKILGGNLGIKTKEYQNLVPFFSDSYEVDGRYVLSRGEDTLLGLSFEEGGHRCVDIDTKIFHDTFGNFPKMPNIREEASIKDRFYFACLGWIGRNHFLNYILGRDVKAYYEYQREKLVESSKKLSSYLMDSRFEVLPLANDITYERLPKVIEEYEKTLLGFQKFIHRL